MSVQGFEVRDINTYTRPPRGNRRYPLRIAKITFEGRILPDTVVVGGQRLSVREFVPAPHQCSKCWRYGHGYKFCKAELHTCPICSAKGHQKDNCTENINKTCINCKGNHPAFSRSCSEYKKQQLIVKTRFREGLSYKAALDRLRQTGEITPYNFKKALINKNTTTTSTPKISKFTTENKYSVLQIEDDTQSPTISQETSQKSPKRKTKRFRDNSYEEGKLNPKQKQKTASQNNEIDVHEVVAEIHANEVSMDATIIYTDDDYEKPNVETEKTSLTSKSTSPAVSPLESTSPTVLPSETTFPADLPSECG